VSRKITRWEKFRDRLANRIANWALVHIATWEYQKAVWWTMRLGDEVLREKSSVNKKGQGGE
jgi:hypothetical protein